MNREWELGKELHKNVPPNWYFQSLRIDPFQRYWHERRFEEVSHVIEPAKYIIDVGCADGTFSKIIIDKSKASKLIAVDVLKNSIDWASRHWRKEKRIKFMVADAHNLPFKADNFDAIFCLEVLEHVYNPKKALREFKRILKKGGYGVFLVPSDSLLFRIIWFFWLNFYPRGWVWKETHIQTYRNNYLTTLCKEVGFKIEVDKKFNLGMLHLLKVRK